MHIIIGFAIVVGLLAVPATRKVVLWMAGITAVAGLAIFLIVSLVTANESRLQHIAAAKQIADSSLCSPDLVRSGNAAIANHRLPTDAEIVARQCELTGR